jgi:hypothetical protein
MYWYIEGIACNIGLVFYGVFIKSTTVPSIWTGWLPTESTLWILCIQLPLSISLPLSWASHYIPYPVLLLFAGYGPSTSIPISVYPLGHWDGSLVLQNCTTGTTIAIAMRAIMPIFHRLWIFCLAPIFDARICQRPMAYKSRFQKPTGANCSEKILNGRFEKR